MRFSPPRPSMPPLRSALFDCEVLHRRVAPRPYGFRSSMFMFLLELDELDELAERLSLFSRNRFNAYSFYDRDHLYLGHADVRDNVRAYLRREGVDEPVGSIQLLTSLRVLGYVFNPVSYYFVRDPAGEPLAIIAEVHNTFGELKPFLLTRRDLRAEWFQADRPKHFYISPFSDLDHDLRLRLRFPTERLHLFVSNRREGGRSFFQAALLGRRRPLTRGRLLSFSLRFPFVTFKVMALIHWHAFWLWRRGVPLRRKSAQPELQRGILPKAPRQPAT
jgi:uncharacterized protein